MADQLTTRVFFQVHMGLPYRQASDEQRSEVMDSLTGIFRKWKSSGIRLIGYFGAPGRIEGCAHNYVFEVDDVKQVREMDGDIFNGKVRAAIEKYRFHIGWGRGVEDLWESL